MYNQHFADLTPPSNVQIRNVIPRATQDQQLISKQEMFWGVIIGFLDGFFVVFRLELTFLPCLITEQWAG
jgi:hypothetical protein